jgi:hypothetical protein
VNSSPPRYLSALVFVVAFVFRMPSASSLAEWPAGDGVEYEALAWNIASSGRYVSSEDTPVLIARRGDPTAMRTPGLPGFAAVPYRLWGRRPALVRLLLVTANAGAAALLLSMAWAAYGAAVASAAALVWACWPTARVTYFASHAFQAEGLAVPLFIAACWAFQRSHRPPGAVAAGLALGWMFLTRGHLIGIVPPALILFVFFAREHLGRLVAVLAIAAVPCAAWTVRNLVVMRAPILQSTQLGCGLWLGNNASARGSWDGNWLTSSALARVLAEYPELLESAEPVKSRLLAAAAWRDVRSGGWRHLAWLEARKLTLFFWPVEASYGVLWWLIPVLIGLPIGVFVAVAEYKDPLSLLLVASVLGAILITMVFFHDSRYRYSVEPAMVVLSALGWRRAAARWPWRRREGAAQGGSGGATSPISMMLRTAKTSRATNTAIPT